MRGSRQLESTLAGIFVSVSVPAPQVMSRPKLLKSDSCDKQIFFMNWLVLNAENSFLLGVV